MMVGKAVKAEAIFTAAAIWPFAQLRSSTGCRRAGLVQVWSIGQPTPNFTLEGHDKGVNCVDYYNGGKRRIPASCTPPQLLQEGHFPEPCLEHSALKIGM